MSLYTRFASGLLFPLHEKLKGHNSVAVRQAMEQSQWWPPEQMKTYQVQRLRSFLETVSGQVPYYRNLFRELDFSPEKVSSIADLQQIPFLTKSLRLPEPDVAKIMGLNADAIVDEALRHRRH